MAAASFKIITIALFSLMVSYVAFAAFERINEDFFKHSQSWQTISAPPELTGPDQLCNVVGSVVGVFSGGGDPATDVYKWTVLAPNGSTLFTRPPGAFQTIEYTFESLGLHQVKLEVSRGGISLASFTKNVAITKAPEITLIGNYKICTGQSLELQAISPSSDKFTSYFFEWKNESGVVIGSSNTLSVSAPGDYSVTFYIPDPSNPVCENTLQTKVETLDAISIVKSTSNVCKDQSITFTADPPVAGQWLLTLPGEPTAISKGFSSTLTLLPVIDLPVFGNYNLELIIENLENPACSPTATSDFAYNEEPIVSLFSTFGASDCFVPDGGLELLAETDIDQLVVEGTGLVFGPFLAGEPITIPNLKSGGYTFIYFLNGCQNKLGAVIPLENPPTNLEFEIENINAESCTTNGKINGSFDVNLDNGPTDGSFRILSVRGDVVIKQALPAVNPFKIELAGGRYFFELLDKDSCNLPTRELIEIPVKPQTVFSIPEQLTICGAYDLIPETTENLVFTLTDPSGNMLTRNSGEPFTLTDAGEYSLVGTLPAQSDICPSEKKLTVATTNEINFDPVLKSEDCIIGNRVFEAEIYGADPDKSVYFWRNAAGNIIGSGKELFLSPTSIGKFTLEVQPKDSEACPILPKEFEVAAPVLFVDATITSTKLCEFGPEAILELVTTSPEAVTDIRWRRFDENGDIVELPEFRNKQTITTRIGGTYEAAAFSIIPQINKNCELGRATFQLDLTPDKVVFDIPSELTICDFHELIPVTSQNLDFFVTTPSGAVVDKPSGQTFTLDEAGTYTFLAFDQASPTSLCPEQKELIVTLASPVDFRPILSDEFCDGSRIFQASISNYDLADVDIMWSDENGNPLGNGEFLTITTPGNYKLLVQPAGVIPCHISPIAFEVLPPVLDVEVRLVAEPFCPDSPSATIRAEADFSQVSLIEW
ncbi:MAG: hypothetical protein ABJJ26_14085, partial [Algoriphagus sp.]